MRNLLLAITIWVTCSLQAQPSKKEYRIALVLPFQSGSAQTSLSEAMLDYFEGFKMAAAYLETEGLKLKLYTFDCEKDSMAMEDILDHPDLKKMDVIVGPVYEKNLVPMEEFCAKHNILLVSPLKYYAPRDSNTTVINFFCPDSLRMQSIAEKCARMYSKHKIYIVQDNSKQSQADALLMKAVLRRMRHPFVKVVSLTNGKLIPQPIISDSAILISTIASADAKAALVKAIKNKPASYVIAYLDWNGSIQSTFLISEPQVIYPDVNFVSYHDSFATKFRDAFFENYYGEPSKYAYIGYDQATYICYGLMTFGRSFCQHLPDAEFRGLINVIRLMETKDGIVNTGLNYLQIIEEERLEYAP